MIKTEQLTINDSNLLNFTKMIAFKWKRRELLNNNVRGSLKTNK